MLKYLLAVAALLFASPSFAQCDTAQVAQQNMQRQNSYSGLGNMAANVLGNSDMGRQLRGFGIGRQELRQAGRAAGVHLAGPLTRGLDQCDQQWLTGSTSEALESSHDSEWNNPQTGASGENRIVPTSRDVLRANPGKDCRTIEQYIALSDGGSRVQTVSACRGDDGAWETVS